MKPLGKTTPLDRTRPSQELVNHGPLHLAREPCPLLPLTEAQATTQYLSNRRVIQIYEHNQDYLRSLYPDLAALDAPAPAPTRPLSTSC